MTWQKIVVPLLLLSALAGPGRKLCAAEYFVSLDGNDAGDGLSRAAAFRTVQRGVDALAEGDTLTIAPGEYHESVTRADLGGEDRDTVIRAEIPGTALLRGDVPAPAFSRVPGYRYVYAADFEGAVQAVNETDTLVILETAPAPAELEFLPGACHYDAAQKKLYISTSDMRAPERHHYTVSVIDGHGLGLERPTRVVVEGLAATGFSNADMRTWHTYYTVWGFHLGESRRCVLRDVTAWLNGGGIAVHSNGERSGGNLIERAAAWANQTRYSLEGGNIMGYAANDDEIRDARSWLGGPNGIRFYGAGIRGPARLKNALSWGAAYADIFLKGGEVPRYGLAENCVSVGIMHSRNVKNCLVGTDNQYNREPGPDTVMLAGEAGLDPDREFADPANLDFRLQATSRFRGAGPGGADRGPFPYRMNIFYLDPAGDDAADGLSAASAWRTLPRALAILRPGDTLYLAGGIYDGPRVPFSFPRGAGAGRGEVITIRGRGTKPVVIREPLWVTGAAGLVFERLNFTGTVVLEDGSDITFDNCRFWPGAWIEARAVRGLRVTHGEFAWALCPALKLADVSGVFLRGNIFDNGDGQAAVALDRTGAVAYSDYNSYRDAARAWQAGGVVLGFAALRAGGRELYSREADPNYRFADGRLEPADPDRFAGRGPLGRDLGFHRDFRPRTVRVDGPVVHSSDDTSANLEWHSSGPVTCEVGWGATPGALDVRATVRGSGFTSFSVTGLEPGRRYYFAILSAAVDTDGGLRPTETVFSRAPVSFETLPGPRAPAAYYVAPDGDDGRDGLSRDRAWRTVSRAAAVAGPGDTVFVAGGTYQETVRVRATGQSGRPVTFRAAPGEKVVFDGRQRLFKNAFVLTYKYHVHLDGFYFQQFRMAGWEGVVDLYRSDHARVTRCFKIGRGAGYSPRFIQARHSAGLLVRNCVVTNGFEGVVLRGCPDARLEHNVFLRTLIQAAILDNNPAQKVYLLRNIITDSTPAKVGGTLVELARVESLVEENNCYFLRVPDEERKPFCFYGNEEFERSALAYGTPIVYPQPPLITELARMSLAEYRRRFAPGTGSLAVDPRFAAAAGIGGDVFVPDRLVGQADLDFPGLFATNPEVMALGIGLQPEAFDDFHFNRQ